MDTHGLTIREKAAEYISGTNGMAVKIVGMTSMTILLVLTLELDVANVAVCSGDFYKGLLGCDLLCGHKKALSATTVTLLGQTNWVPLAGHRGRWVVLWLSIWNCKSLPRQ